MNWHLQLPQGQHYLVLGPLSGLIADVSLVLPYCRGMCWKLILDGEVDGQIVAGILMLQYENAEGSYSKLDQSRFAELYVADALGAFD